MTFSQMKDELEMPDLEEVLKKANHRVNVVRIKDVLPCPNADALELIWIGGYQCVVRKGAFKTGDLGVYIQPDSVIPQTEPFRFIWEGYQCEPDGTVPEKRRRITVRKLRKQLSEGLLLPFSDFPNLKEASLNSTMVKYLESDTPYLKLMGKEELCVAVSEGDDVSEVLGITHYEPEEKGTGGYEYAPKKKRRLPKTFRGWLNYIFRFRWLWAAKRRMCGESTEVGVNAPRYDVEVYKNHVGSFEEGELVDVTEKIHGSNARYMFLDGHMFAGSRNLWKAPDSKCIWRRVLIVHPWIQEWCMAHEGYALYGELTPTQSGFDYGDLEPQFFVFDIYTPQGEWVKPWRFNEAAEGIMRRVPLIVSGMPWNEAVIKALVDGRSQVPGANHIREGVVVSPVQERIAYNIGRLQLKIISNLYYEKESKSTI